MNTEPIDLRDQVLKGYTGRGTLEPEDLEGEAVHHSVSGWAWNPLTQQYTGQAWNEAVDIPQEVEVAHILAIDRWHNQEAFGYCGFGYHIAVFASGRWYLVGDLNSLRAHVASRNWGWIGIVFIGDFSNAVPGPKQIEGGQQAASWVRGQVERQLAVRPHLLVPGQNTTCPGKRYAEWVPLIDAGWKEEESMVADPRVDSLYQSRRWLQGLMMAVSGYSQVAAGLCGHAWNAAEYEELKQAIAKADAKLQFARQLLKNNGLATECGPDGIIDTYS